MSEGPSRPVAQFNVLDVESELREAHRKAGETADRLIEAAEAKARTLLQEALAERDADIARAKEEGRQKGYEEGLREGRAHGEQQIIEEQREVAQQGVTDVLNALQDLPVKLERGRERLVEEARRDLLSLTLDVARVAAAKAVPEPGDAAAALLADLVPRLNDRHHLVVEVSATDQPTLDQALPEIRKRFDDIEQLDLKIREDLEAGTVIVRNDVTELESSVEDTLERLAAEWGL